MVSITDRQVRPPGLTLLFLSSFIAHVAFSGVFAMLAVFLADSETEASALSLSGLAAGLSYLVSVALASRADSRAMFPSALALCAFGCWLTASDQRLVGIALVILGLGAMRPAVLARIEAQRGGLAAERAMAWYTIVLNAGFVAGPLLADHLRLHYGWSVAFLALAVIAGVGLAAGLLAVSGMPQPRTQTPNDVAVGDHPPWLLVAVLLSVAGFYAYSQQAVSSIALLVDRESAPMRLGHFELTLTAGRIASIHGLLVALGALPLARFTLGPLGVVLGQALYCGALLIFSRASSPMPGGDVLLAFFVLSLAESISGPSLLALGARFRRSRRGLFWLAGVAGMLGSGLYSSQWTRLNHREYFLYAATFPVVIGLLVLWRSTRGGWR
jgi:MFS family permease